MGYEIDERRNGVNEREARMENLRTFVEAGREYLERHGDLNLGYVDGIVIPELRNVLKDLCPKIEERHKIDEPEGRQENFVIHYTSIGTLVSMLQQKVKNKQNVAKDEQDASLRLYDSVHFNDPDEGNYFYRNLNLPKKYDWLDKKKESHAYITSFIIPDLKRDMSDNLVFWRTYGKEGEGCSLKLRILRDRLRKVLCDADELRKVLYGADEVKRTGKLLRPVLDALYPLVSIRKRSQKKKVREELAEVIWKYLEKIRYLYKSEAYEYERECRFVIPEPESDADKDKIRFEYKEQNNSPDVRHYYEHENLKVENILTTDSLITIGPRVSHPYNMSYYIKSLLTKAGLVGPEIKLSKIFYRKT